MRKPDNKRLVGCKWIYIIKDRVSTTEPRRFKARLVEKGYTVKTRPKSTRILSALGRSPHGFVPKAAHTTPKGLLATQGLSPLIA